jgi:hypothetical protein
MIKIATFALYFTGCKYRKHIIIKQAFLEKKNFIPCAALFGYNRKTASSLMPTHET